MATNNTIVCIITDLVDKKNPKKKRKFYLPASKKVADVIQEVADTCGYNANTISMNYEKPSVSGYYDVKVLFFFLFFSCSFTPCNFWK